MKTLFGYGVLALIRGQRAISSVATDSALLAFHSAVEFCAILNAAIRADRADEMVHAAMFTRAINQRRIQRVANVLEKSRQVLRAPLPGH